MSEESISVAIGGGYEVVVGNGFLDTVGDRIRNERSYRRVALVTDENVRPLYAEKVLASLKNAGFSAELCAVPAGETSKSLQMLEKLYSFFLSFGLTRTDAVVYVGGGVVGDLAGFAAATYLRGVDYFAVPTTFLAMLDSAVGGKTGVDLKEGKNLAGAFWQPRAVYADISTLRTLDEENFRCGVGEALKYAMIADPSMLPLLNGRKDPETLKSLVVKGLQVKKYCVEQDPFDRGIRQYLNFGHTLGHVIEKNSGYRVPHGVAVGIGMVEITRYSENMGWTEQGTADQIAAALKSYGMPTEDAAGAEALLAGAKNDKKRKGDLLTLVLLKRVGECFLKEIEVAP